MLTAGTSLYLSKSHKRPKQTTPHLTASGCITSSSSPVAKSSYVANPILDGTRNTLWPTSPLAEGGSDGWKLEPHLHKRCVFSKLLSCALGKVMLVKHLLRGEIRGSGKFCGSQRGWRRGWSLHSSLSCFTQMLGWLTWRRSYVLRLWHPYSIMPMTCSYCVLAPYQAFGVGGASHSLFCLLYRCADSFSCSHTAKSHYESSTPWCALVFLDVRWGKPVFPLFLYVVISSHFKSVSNRVIIAMVYLEALASLERSSCINLKCLVRWYPGDLCVNNKHVSTCHREAPNEREGKYRTSKTVRGLFRFEVPQARTTPSTLSHPINVTKQLSSMWCAVVGTSSTASTMEAKCGPATTEIHGLCALCPKRLLISLRIRSQLRTQDREQFSPAEERGCEEQLGGPEGWISGDGPGWT